MPIYVFFMSFRVGIFPPGDISYLPDPEKLVNRADQLGQRFSFEIRVVNNGPSVAPLTHLSVLWPLFLSPQNDQFFLYPVRITTVSDFTLFSILFAIEATLENTAKAWITVKPDENI